MALSKEPIKVLNDGFVRLVDVMGDDSSITQAARVSYGEGTKAISDDEHLIRYMYRNYHHSPFEMCEIKLHIRIPMDAWRQMIRHRTANVNEYSTRYSTAINSMTTTLPGEWRLQSSSNKQGSTGTHEDGIYLSAREAEFQNMARAVYDDRIESGIAREQARKDLPLCTYSEAYWKVDLRNLLHFLGLRMDEHAQYEIRQYANAISTIVKDWVPLAWAAFEDYHPMRGAMVLTARDLAVIQLGEAAAELFGWLKYAKTKKTCPCCKGRGDIMVTMDGKELCVLKNCICSGEGKIQKLLRNRERMECAAKLEKLGMPIPWSRWDGEV